jgi:hypothetical protein
MCASMLKTCMIVVFLIALSGLSRSAETSLSCLVFAETYNDSARSLFAYGYLEGVQAALTKEIADVIVPPSDQDHPIWWVLPSGGVSMASIKDKLNAACKAQPTSDLVKAALSIASRKEGWPKFGVWIDKKTGELSKDHDKFKKFLAGDPATCESYNALNEPIRQALVEGYFVGTETYRVAMKERPDVPWMAWPLGIEPRTVRLKLDEGCADPKEQDGTIRDALWVETITMSVRQMRQSPPKK